MWGDVCSPGILEELRGIAPLDHRLRQYGQIYGSASEEVIELAGCWILMIHNLEHLDIEPSGRFQVVLHGHTHTPDVRENGMCSISIREVPDQGVVDYQ